MAPVPYRGKRNESSYILNILEKLSDIYEVSTDKIASITTENSEELFWISDFQQSTISSVLVVYRWCWI